MLPQATWSQIERWLRDPRYAEERAALQRLVDAARSGDEDALAELRDAFDGPLPIGTGGRRGACGPGTNRMNIAVLRETAQGLAHAMKAEGVPMRVAVVYDTRRDSRRFAHAVADELAAWGVHVLVVDAPRPTPLLSYTVRARGCGAGIVISASHNPAGDNGIKVYGPDGAQVLGRRDRALMAAIEHAMANELRGGGGGSIEMLATPDEIAVVEEPYLDFVRAQRVCGDEVARAGLRIVYTPLHGVGHTSVLPVLRSCGLEVAMVEAQAPDEGRFGTVVSANPEAPAALELARQQAERDGADLVIATDPDADRLGALARGDDGRFAFIDGNQLAVLMLDHVLRHAKPPKEETSDRGGGPARPSIKTKDGWVLTTVVSSPLIGALARAAGVDVVDDLLVGFKHHAGMMAEQPDRTVVFATEEAHGYLRGDDVHDKDGAIAALLLAEAAAVAKADGHTLFDQLRRVWTERGYHRERTENIFAYGAAGREAIATLMDAWRREPPSSFAGLSVVSVDDRKQPRSTGSATRDLPGNVLVFELQTPGTAACRLVLRPSGTEPKVKVYALARSTRVVGLQELPRVEAEIDALVDRVLADAAAAAQRTMTS